MLTLGDHTSGKAEHTFFMERPLPQEESKLFHRNGF